MFALGFASFFAFGCVLVLLGASQAGLERDLDLDLTRTGMLAAALAFGLFGGVVGAGPIFDRFSRRPLYVGACTTAGIALLAVNPDTSFISAWLLVALVGAGTGAYDTLFNAAVVERYREDSIRPMSVLHAATTVGAIACPIGVAWIATQWHWSVAFHAIGIAHLGMAVVALFVSFPSPPDRVRTPSSPIRSVVSWPLLPFALVAFTYVGVEGALTIFAVPYAGGLELPAVRGQSAISAFWFGLLVGRLAPIIGQSRLGGRALAIAGTASAIATAAGVGTELGQIEVLFGVIGVALGCVYPVMITEVGLQFPHARGTAAGLTAGVGAIGGFIIPAASGALGDAVGIGMTVGSLALCCGLLALGGYGVMRLRPVR